LPTLATTTIAPFNNLLPAIKPAQDTNPLGADMKSKIGYPDLSTTGGQDQSTEKDADKQWNIILGALTFEGKIYMAEALCNQVIWLFQDNPKSGHFGSHQTAELVSRDFYWVRLDTTVQKYVTR
jgi:hypothetical protein